MRHAFTSSCLLLIAFIGTPPHVVEEFSARVIGVTDGDTITVLQGQTQVKVRLEGIDAPEKSQAFGSKSKAELSSLVYSKTVTVQKTGTDNYGRTLARINVNGKDAAEFMLSKGMAWHYKEYSKDQTLSEMEQKARTAKLGLWSEENALAPWEFRRRQRDNSRSVTDESSVAANASSSPKDATGLGYWLNTSSNTRHNASCQYFKNTKRGRACDKSDGKACGTCGG